MTPLLLAPIALTLWLVWTAVRGPRRYFRTVTAEVRPGTPEPTDDGYLVLGLRWWLAALLALVVTPWAVWDDVAVTDDALFEAVSRAKTVVPVDEFDLDRLLAEAERDLGMRLDYEAVESATAPDADFFEVYREVLGVRTGEVCVSVSGSTSGGTSPSSVVLSTSTNCAP